MAIRSPSVALVGRQLGYLADEHARGDEPLHLEPCSQLQPDLVSRRTPYSFPVWTVRSFTLVQPTTARPSKSVLNAAGDACIRRTCPAMARCCSTTDRLAHPWTSGTWRWSAIARLIRLLRRHSDDRDGQFSPDGKWVAYQSNEAGHNEIYLRPFPGPGDRLQVSAGGGQQLRWAPRGAELFYLAADQRSTSVPVTFTPNGAVTLGHPLPLFRDRGRRQLPGRQQYAVSPDGQRFLVNARTDGVVPPSNHLSFCNWDR